MRRAKVLLLPIPALVLALGCGSSVHATDDGSTDTQGDAGPDIYVDLVPDPTTEPTPDTAPSDIHVDTTPGEGAVGDPCTDAANCMGVPTEGRTCLTIIPMGGGYDIHFPGGYCSGDCYSAGDCGPGGDCVDFWGYGVCLKSCTSDGECRTAEGYVCYSIPYVTEQTYCVPYT